MRILIVSQWFQPEPHFKGLAFAEALRTMGHEVEVITGFPNYPGGKVYPNYRLRPVSREVMNGISIVRGYLYPSHDRSAVRRIANYVSFALSSTILIFTRPLPDVVYVYTPPMTAALAPVALRLLRGVPFVCDVQDLWPDTLAATGMVTNRHVLSWVGRWTDFALRRAARVVVLSTGFRDRLIDRGLDGRQIAVIRNWAPPEIVEVANALPASTGRPDGVFTILFAGNMGKAQGLDVVLGAAAILHRRGTHIRFAMIGGGVEVGRLKERVAAMQLPNIAFHDPVHPSQMAGMFTDADALLVHLRDDPLFEITIPSKIQAYLAVGRPILLGVRGDAAQLVSEAGAGIAFAPDDAKGLAEAASRLSTMSVDERAAMGLAGRRYYREQLSFEAGTAAIEMQLREAASAGGAKSARRP